MHLLILRLLHFFLPSFCGGPWARGGDAAVPLKVKGSAITYSLHFVHFRFLQSLPPLQQEVSLMEAGHSGNLKWWPGVGVCVLGLVHPFHSCCFLGLMGFMSSKNTWVTPSPDLSTPTGMLATFKGPWMESSEIRTSFSSIELKSEMTWCLLRSSWCFIFCSQLCRKFVFSVAIVDQWIL